MLREKGKHRLRARVVMMLSLAGWLSLSFSAEAKIIADCENQIYHRDTCPEVKAVKKRNWREFDSEPEAESRGFFPCKTCITPANQPSLKEKEIKKLSVPVAREKIYIGDREKKVYHHEWCPLVNDIPEKNLRQFENVKKAIELEYTACKECNPPVMFKRRTMQTAPEVIEPGNIPKPPSSAPAGQIEALPGEEGN
ncbi:hypothetical protein JW933_04785 [candidate division FCPU426 bacterium]|nr:hypothetical protein [candidate division FCPU426 bacterium]